MRQVGVNVRPGDAGGCVISALGLAEDADEVGDPLLVSLPGQQRHDHQLDAQEHEEVAAFGMNADHGDGRHAAPRAGARRKSSEVIVNCGRSDFAMRTRRLH